MNRDDTGAPVKDCLGGDRICPEWKRRQEEDRPVDGGTTSSIWDTRSWKFMGLRCREQGEVALPTPAPRHGS